LAGWGLDVPDRPELVLGRGLRLVIYVDAERVLGARVFDAA
jgi:hypothetical protein